MVGAMIGVADEGHVRICTIDRAERRNAFDQHHYHALADALGAAADDADVHVVLITGTGTAFSAGQDLQELAAISNGTAAAGASGGFPHLLMQLESFPKPLVVAVNGDAVGIGMTMLLHCDIALVATEARLRVPFSELGVPPEAGSSVLLADLIGWQRAAELLFTSRWIDGDEAVTLGLALRTSPRAHVVADALALATSIAEQSPWAVQTAKQLMLAGRGERSRQARSREDAAFIELFATSSDD